MSQYPLLCLAIAMAAGLAMSRVIRYVHLPNVTAYLIAGVLLGPVFGVLDVSATSSLSIISDVALGFIAYSIGAEFKLSYLKNFGIKPIVITCFESVFASLVVFLALNAISQPLPVSLTLAAIAAATAPAATLMVIRQYKAKGPVCSMLLPVVAMDDATGLILYAVLSNLAISLDREGTQLSAVSLLLMPLLQIIFSLLLGVAIGFVLSLVLRFFHSRGNKLALTLCAVFLGVGLSATNVLNLSSLLVCIMIGATMVNLCHDSTAMLEQCDRFTPPLFMLFFVLSGAGLNFSVLTTVGLVGVIYVIARVAGKVIGATLGAVVEKCDRNIVRYLGLTLIPQAGVAIGMARLAMQDLPEYGAIINAVVLAGTLVYELTGPVITKTALLKAGEITPENAGAGKKTA
ncbi:MAG: cation:proton antiporter [Oscillospiraceae bacterium]|nr:cation:proton antiporter [Oscillospiraceae bacterium]